MALANSPWETNEATDPPTVPDPTAEVMAAMALRPETGWRTSDLVRHLHGRVRVVDVMLTIMELHRTGGLERLDIATYRLPTAARYTALNPGTMARGGPTSSRRTFCGIAIPTRASPTLAGS